MVLEREGAAVRKGVWPSTSMWPPAFLKAAMSTASASWVSELAALLLWELLEAVSRDGVLRVGAVWVGLEAILADMSLPCAGDSFCG